MITSFQWLSRLPESVIKSGSMALVVIVGVIDYLTGLDVAVTLFYLIPVSMGTWFAGRPTGLFMACASAVVWLGADALCRATVGHPLVALWNTVTLGLGFVFVAFLLSAIKDKNDHLEQTVMLRTEKLRNEIAERVRAEQQLKETNAALTAIREDLQRAFVELQKSHAELQRTQMQLVEAAKMESVGRLAAGIAHEVKNPLMTLSLGADYFLARPTATTDERTLVQDMKEAVHRASNIINLLLDLSRPRSLERANEDINSLIENSLTLVRHQLNKERVSVVREFQPAMPQLLLDRTRIEHVLVNLFLNALQAMPEGGTLTVRTHASVATDNRPSQVTVEVQDTGLGIKPEDLGKLFEPFFTTKPPGHGTGLGLAIVRKIVEIHGGSISLSNRREGGAQATLIFNAETKG
jgi:signal transduction histidine kinase